MVSVTSAMALMSRLTVGDSYWFLGIVLGLLGHERHQQMSSSRVVAALPPAASHAARDSIGGAVEVAGHQGPVGHQLVADARA